MKRVEFYSKNKFEKLVHLVGFIIRKCHDAQSPERQKRKKISYICQELSPGLSSQYCSHHTEYTIHA